MAEVRPPTSPEQQVKSTVETVRKIISPEKVVIKAGGGGGALEQDKQGKEYTPQEIKDKTKLDVKGQETNLPDFLNANLLEVAKSVFTAEELTGLGTPEKKLALLQAMIEKAGDPRIYTQLEKSGVTKGASGITPELMVASIQAASVDAAKEYIRTLSTTTVEHTYRPTDERRRLIYTEMIPEDEFLRLAGKDMLTVDRIIELGTDAQKIDLPISNIVIILKAGLENHDGKEAKVSATLLNLFERKFGDVPSVGGFAEAYRKAINGESTPEQTQLLADQLDLKKYQDKAEGNFLSDVVKKHEEAVSLPKIAATVREDLMAGQQLHNSLLPPEMLVELAKLEQKDPENKLLETRQKYYRAILCAYDVKPEQGPLTFTDEEKALADKIKQSSQQKVEYTDFKGEKRVSEKGMLNAVDANRLATADLLKTLGVSDTAITELHNKDLWTSLQMEMNALRGTRKPINDQEIDNIFKRHGIVTSGENQPLLRKILIDRLNTDLRLAGLQNQVESRFKNLTGGDLPENLVLSVFRSMGLKGVEFLYRRSLTETKEKITKEPIPIPDELDNVKIKLMKRVQTPDISDVLSQLEDLTKKEAAAIPSDKRLRELDPRVQQMRDTDVVPISEKVVKLGPEEIKLAEIIPVWKGKEQKAVIFNDGNQKEGGRKYAVPFQLRLGTQENSLALELDKTDPQEQRIIFLPDVRGQGPNILVFRQTDGKLYMDDQEVDLSEGPKEFPIANKVKIVVAGFDPETKEIILYKKVGDEKVEFRIPKKEAQQEFRPQQPSPKLQAETLPAREPTELSQEAQKVLKTALKDRRIPLRSNRGLVDSIVDYYATQFDNVSGTSANEIAYKLIASSLKGTPEEIELALKSDTNQGIIKEVAEALTKNLPTSAQTIETPPTLIGQASSPASETATAAETVSAPVGVAVPHAQETTPSVDLSKVTAEIRQSIAEAEGPQAPVEAAAGVTPTGPTIPAATEPRLGIPAPKNRQETFTLRANAAAARHPVETPPVIELPAATTHPPSIVKPETPNPVVAELQRMRKEAAASMGEVGRQAEEGMKALLDRRIPTPIPKNVPTTINEAAATVGSGTTPEDYDTRAVERMLRGTEQARQKAGGKFPVVESEAAIPTPIKLKAAPPIAGPTFTEIPTVSPVQKSKPIVRFANKLANALTNMLSGKSTAEKPTAVKVAESPAPTAVESEAPAVETQTQPALAVAEPAEPPAPTAAGPETAVAVEPGVPAVEPPALAQAEAGVVPPSPETEADKQLREQIKKVRNEIVLVATLKGQIVSGNLIERIQASISEFNRSTRNAPNLEFYYNQRSDEVFLKARHSEYKDKVDLDFFPFLSDSYFTRDQEKGMTQLTHSLPLDEITVENANAVLIFGTGEQKARVIEILKEKYGVTESPVPTAAEPLPIATEATAEDVALPTIESLNLSEGERSDVEQYFYYQELIEALPDSIKLQEAIKKAADNRASRNPKLFIVGADGTIKIKGRSLGIIKGVFGRRTVNNIKYFSDVYSLYNCLTSELSESEKTTVRDLLKKTIGDKVKISEMYRLPSGSIFGYMNAIIRFGNEEQRKSTIDYLYRHFDITPDVAAIPEATDRPPPPEPDKVF